MDAATLLATVRQAREFEVSHEGITVRARVPTQYEIQRFFASDPSAGYGDLCMRFALGWAGVRVCDVLGHGTDESPAPFSSELFKDFAGERPALLAALLDELLRRYNERTAAKEAEAKN